MQYESPVTSGLKVMTKVNFFSKVGQTLRSRSLDQKLWYHVKGLVIKKYTYEINMRALSLMVLKVWPRLNFLSTQSQR